MGAWVAEALQLMKERPRLMLQRMYLDVDVLRHIQDMDAVTL